MGLAWVYGSQDRRLSTNRRKHVGRTNFKDGPMDTEEERMLHGSSRNCTREGSCPPWTHWGWGGNLGEKRATQSSQMNCQKDPSWAARDKKPFASWSFKPLRDLQTKQKIERGTSVAVKAQESSTLLRLRRHFGVSLPLPPTPFADLSPNT